MPSTVVSRTGANTTAIVAPSAAGPATSGWSNFAELRTEVARRMGGRSDLGTADLSLHVNEAYIDLCSMVDFLFLTVEMSWSCVAQQALYALPTAIREVVLLKTTGVEDVSDDGPLRKVDMQEYARLSEDSADYDDVPEVYTISADNTLALWHRPDAAYSFSMEVKLRPSRLVADTDYPVLPDEWIEILRILATSKAASALNEFELSSQRYNEALGLIRSRRNERAERAEGTKGGIWIPQSASELRRTSRRGYR